MTVSEFEKVSEEISFNLSGDNFAQVLHHDYQDIPEKIKTLKNGESVASDAILGKFDGKYIYVEFQVKCIGDSFFVTFYKPEGLGPEESRVKEPSIAAIADKLLGMFYRSDKHGNIIYFTENSLDLLGYKPDELLGGNLRKQFFLSADKYDSLKDTIVNAGMLEGAEVSLKHKDGRIIWLKVDNTAFYDEDGEYDGAGGYVQDITKYKNIEEELAHARRLLEIKQNELDVINIDMNSRVQSAVTKGRKHEESILYHARLAEMGEMVSSIAHQWRQPLSALTFIIEDIRDAYHFGELDVQYLDDAILECMNYVRFMSETMDDFRNFFRPEPDKEYFNIIEKLVDVIKMQYGRFEVGAVNVFLTCEIDDNPPIEILAAEYGHGVKFMVEPQATDAGIVVFGYPNLFKQVILNIINNAIDAILESRTSTTKCMTEAGRIDIAVGVAGEMAFIRIDDNGTGIEESILSKIFDSGFTTKHKSIGTGIGLHMAESIVEKSLNGSLSAGNQEKGARFIVKLPHVAVKVGS